MVSVISTLVVLALPHIVSAGFGPSWGFYTPNPGFRQDPLIMSATTTLVAPQQPNPILDQIALWPGIDTTGPADDSSNTGLVQALAVSMPDPDLYCYHAKGPQAKYANSNRVTSETASKGEWFVAASYYNNTNTQNMGGCAFVHTGDYIKMTYTYNLRKDSYKQKVRVNGTLVSSFESSGAGSGYTWRVYNECQHNWLGLTPKQTYLDTKIVLRNPDPNFKRFIRKDQQATATGITTPDKGKTWHIKKITLFPGTCIP